MTTRNFVPRNNNEGQLGAENKKWTKIYTNKIFATNFTGNLTGTADNAIKDNKNQQIDSTYIKDISINNDTLTVTKGNDDSQDITINNISHAISSDNATNATKATQDSAGQTINTTYVKGVTANNATLTITKGNGSTSTTTINNVSNATNANNLVISGGTSAHIKYGGGDVDENTAISQNKVNLLIGSWYSTGFRDLCNTGNPIRVAINHRNGNIKTTGNVTANGAIYSATPGTSDNSTRVATTAFVQSLINSLKGSIDGTIVASNLAQNGYVKFSNGLILQWGTFNWFQTIGGKQNFTYTVPFPIVFSSIKWCMPSIPKVVFGQDGAYAQTTYYTNNGVYIHAETGSMQVCAMSANFDYIAIGV